MMIIAIIMLILTPALSVNSYNVYGEELTEDDGEDTSMVTEDTKDEEEDADKDGKESDSKEESGKEEKSSDAKEDSTEKDGEESDAKEDSAEEDGEESDEKVESTEEDREESDEKVESTEEDDKESDEQSEGQIVEIDRDGCIVSITTELGAGDYTLEVWDDGELIDEISHTMSEPGEYIFTWEIEQPAKEGAPGVALAIFDEKGQFIDEVDPYEYPREVANQCSATDPDPNPDPDPDPNPDPEVTPEEPEVTQATCDVPEPKLDLPETEGVLYEIDGDVKAGETVTVIAVPMDGEAEFVIPEGWTLQEEGIATMDIELKEADCEDQVDVKIVTVDRDGCIVSITTELGVGDYTLEVWDDGVLIDEISHTMSESGEYVFTWEIEQPAMEGAPGVAFIIIDENGNEKDFLDPYEYPREVAQICGGVEKDDDKEGTPKSSSDQVTPTPDKEEPKVKATVEEGKEVTASTKGDTLPDTATSMFNTLLAGALLFTLGGIALFIMRKKKYNL